jgi:rhamnogalacturonyl hydrolase YesR
MASFKDIRGPRETGSRPSVAVRTVAALGLAAALTTQLAAAPGGDPDMANLFSTTAIASVMQRADGWQSAHALATVADRNWERGTWYTGVMAAYRATGDQGYLDQAMWWAEKQQWKPGTEKAGANILTCSQTYLELYFLKRDRAFIEPTIAWLDSGRPNTPSGARVWYLDGVRYADSLYVGAPALAMLGQATGDRKYVDWMNAFFWDVHQELFDREDGLFYRDKGFIAQRTAQGRKVLWSRGNGWVFASLPRILTYLPEGNPRRADYQALFRRMAAALVERQQSDGLWRPNLDDPKEFPMPETSGTGFFCYGLAWGVRTRLLDEGSFLPAARKAWAGLMASVSPEGMVEWGQQVGASPEAVKQGDSAEYGTGTFLLAGSEMFRLANGGAPDR